MTSISTSAPAGTTVSKTRPSILSHPFSNPTTHLQIPHKGRPLLTLSTTTTTIAKDSIKTHCILNNFFSFLGFSPTQTQTTQTLHVFEFNEGDRQSPAFLKLGKANPTGKCIGDLASFSNKLYSGDLKFRLGISAGVIYFIEKDPEAGDRYESTYSFYFGSYGHLSAQGPYFSGKDSELVVTGGTGVFKGARGIAKISNVIYPQKLYYVFELDGLTSLPKELIGGDPVLPAPDVKPAVDVRTIC